MSDPSSESNPDSIHSTTEPAADSVATEPAPDEVGDVGRGDAEQIGAELAAVDRALARIESGDYGNCTDCGMRLDDALLESDPTATTCPAHLELQHATEPVVADVRPFAAPDASWGSDG